MPKLVLFDIDGTLINPGGAGRISLTNTFYQMFSIRNAFFDIKMAGKTDIQIIKESLSVHGLSKDDGIMPSIISVYIENLRRAIGNKRKYINPGVVELLNALRKLEDYWLGLLTGNIEPGARIKLEAFGLNECFPVGAFGDDNEDRNKLLPVVVEKFRKLTSIKMAYADCIVIGDTPSDVKCSKPYGATSIAVSTGPYTYESLLKTEADHVLKDLSNAMPLFPILSSHTQEKPSQSD
jgi:phosphoglycolate phosphatase